MIKTHQSDVRVCVGLSNNHLIGTLMSSTSDNQGSTQSMEDVDLLVSHLITLIFMGRGFYVFFFTQQQWTRSLLIQQSDCAAASQRCRQEPKWLVDIAAVLFDGTNIHTRARTLYKYQLTLSSCLRPAHSSPAPTWLDLGSLCIQYIYTHSHIPAAIGRTQILYRRSMRERSKAKAQYRQIDLTLMVYN